MLPITLETILIGSLYRCFRKLMYASSVSPSQRTMFEDTQEKAFGPIVEKAFKKDKKD